MYEKSTINEAKNCTKYFSVKVLPNNCTNNWFQKIVSKMKQTFYKNCVKIIVQITYNCVRRFVQNNEYRINTGINSYKNV